LLPIISGFSAALMPCRGVIPRQSRRSRIAARPAHWRGRSADQGVIVDRKKSIDALGTQIGGWSSAARAFAHEPARSITEKLP
jgi:hypothetical protein